MVWGIDEEHVFPPVEDANEDGLLCVGGDLHPDRLILAYCSGIFPWNDKPCMWFSPDLRSTLNINEYRPSKSLKRLLKSNKFTVKFDSNFRQVIDLCAETHGETWISEEFIDSYCELHDRGIAHSVEVYHEDDLVGGLYGLSLGTAFMGESMFHTVSNASKVAFSALVYQLRFWGFTLLDCQVENEHLTSLGAEDIHRDDYMQQLDKALLNNTKVGHWIYEKESLFCEAK